MLSDVLDLAPVDHENVHQSNPPESSYTVQWQDAEGSKDGYQVDCRCVSPSSLCQHSLNNSVDLHPNPNQKHYDYECNSLTAGAVYNSTIRTVKSSWNPVNINTDQISTSKGFK